MSLRVKKSKKLQHLKTLRVFTCLRESEGNFVLLGSSIDVIDVPGWESLNWWNRCYLQSPKGKEKGKQILHRFLAENSNYCVFLSVIITCSKSKRFDHDQRPPCQQPSPTLPLPCSIIPSNPLHLKNWCAAHVFVLRLPRCFILLASSLEAPLFKGNLHSEETNFCPEKC